MTIETNSQLDTDKNSGRYTIVKDFSRDLDAQKHPRTPELVSRYSQMNTEERQAELTRLQTRQDRVFRYANSIYCLGDLLNGATRTDYESAAAVIRIMHRTIQAMLMKLIIHILREFRGLEAAGRVDGRNQQAVEMAKKMLDSIDDVEPWIV